MALCKNENSLAECLEAVSINETPQHPLFRLPCELRQMIFWWSIEFSRSPSPELIHETNLRVKWKDRPSPLLSTNKQIRKEVIGRLRYLRLFTIRVTTFGVAFDMLSLSCFIAQNFMDKGLPKSYTGLPGLQIEIWPPHSHESRQIEMVYLYEHLQTLRDELRAGPQIPQIAVCFQESKLVEWAENGAPRECLWEEDSEGRNDVELVLDHFAYITNVDKASIQLPSSLQYDKNAKRHAEIALERMEDGFLKEDVDLYEDFTDATWENPFYHDLALVKDGLLTSIGWERESTEEIDYVMMFRAWYGDLQDEYSWYSKVDDFNRPDGYVSDYLDGYDTDRSLEQEFKEHRVGTKHFIAKPWKYRD